MASRTKLILLLGLLSAAWPAHAQSYDVDDQQAGQPYGDQAPPPPVAEPQYGYVGVHPIPYNMGSGICYQNEAHFHPYPPFDQYVFRQNNGYFYFVGDIADFGYSLQTWGYSGHHPIPYLYGGGYCFIDWPHRHHYPPPEGIAYNFTGGFYIYAGPWDPWYYQYRDSYTAYYGGYYHSNYYHGAYYTVRPPPIYQPPLVVGAPGVYRPGVTVAAPGGRRIVVSPPAPSGVRVGPPAPYHPAAPGAHYGAPPPGYRATPEVHGATPQYVAPQYHHAPQAPTYRAAPAPSYHPGAPAPMYRPAPAPNLPPPAPRVHMPPPPSNRR